MRQAGKSMEKFVLVLRFIGAPAPLAIEPEEFDDCVRSLDGLGLALTIEEKFDVVLENYIELEKFLIEVCLDDMIRISWTNLSMRNDARGSNRQLINLMSTGRLYVDALQQDVASRANAGTRDLPTKVKRTIDEVGRSSFAYRAITAIRNHAQHRGLPLSESKPRGTWVPKYSHEELVFRVAPLLDLKAFQADNKFPEDIAKELSRRFGDEINCLALIRQYIQDLSEIQDKVRQLLAPLMSTWKSCLEGIRLKAREGFDADGPGLAVARTGPEGEMREVRHVSKALLEQIDILMARNRVPIANLSKRYLCTSVSDHYREGS